MLTPQEDHEDDAELPQINLTMRLQINEKTGMSSDYFSDFRSLEALIRDFDKTIPEAVQSSLTSNPKWRIKTYAEYVRVFLTTYLARDLFGRADECLQLFNNEIAQGTMPLLDECVGILNEEIDKVRGGHPINEQRFRENWNQVKLYIFGTQGFSI